MRIGVISPPWAPVPPVNYGGTEAFVDRLCRELEALGHHVVLFATGDATCPVETRWVYTRSQPDDIGDSLVEIRHAVHAYDSLVDVDVIQDNTLVGPLYARRFEVPVVATNHGPFRHAFNDLYRGSDDRVSLVAISHHQASTARDVRIDAVIHHGLDLDTFPVGRGDGGYWLFLGRMTPDKGAREAALSAREAEVPLVIAAKMREPAEKEYFHEQVEPLLSSDVEYVGEIGGDQKLGLLGGAIGLLNPIRWPEPFGLVMVEALATGTPVLAFPEGAAPEIVRDGETGFLCNDVTEMASRIAAIGQIDRDACRNDVAERFTSARMAQAYSALFAQLLARNHAA